MVFGRHTESVYSEDMSHAKKITDNQPLLDNLTKLMWEASDAIMSVYREDDFGEALKSDESPVTRADLAAHQILIEGLTKLTEDIPVVSEEDPDSVAIGRQADCYWLIDPLDGTKEFINRNEEFTCNLALVEDHRPTLGFVSVPATGLLYLGGPNFTSRRTDRTGNVTGLTPTKHTGITRVVASKSHLNSETRAFIDAIEGPTKLVQAGSSLKFLKIAEGLADVYPRLGPTCEWDTAAAHAVVLGVGGSVKDLERGRAPIRKRRHPQPPLCRTGTLRIPDRWSVGPGPRTLVHVVQRQLRPELDRRDHATGQHAPGHDPADHEGGRGRDDPPRHGLHHALPDRFGRHTLSLLSGLRYCLHLITYLN